MTDATATGTPAELSPQQPQHRIQPLRAWRAIRKLLADPEQTPQVFEIIAALSGNNLQRNFRILQSIPGGLALCDRRDALLEDLHHREALKALPAGSLGRCYATFMDGEDLSPDGLVEASEVADRAVASEQHNWLSMRLRDSHDLWHVVTGYGRDELGELSLLAFTFAQTRNPGIAAIIVFGAYDMGRGIGFGRTLGCVREGWRRGRQASWLAAQDWRALLPLPLESVRAALNVTPAVRYQPLPGEPVADAATA